MKRVDIPIPYVFLKLPRFVKLGTSAFAWHDFLSEYHSSETCAKPFIIDTVQRVDDEVLVNCTGITKLIISKGITEIGNAAFCNCDNLRTVVMPDTVKEMGSGVFGMCKNLSLVRLSRGLSEIKSGTFSQCGKLEKIVLPENIRSIWSHVFNGCDHLTVVVCKASDPPELYDKAFDDNFNGNFYVPDVETYIHASGWSNYKYKIHPISDIEEGMIPFLN